MKEQLITNLHTLESIDGDMQEVQKQSNERAETPSKLNEEKTHVGFINTREDGLIYYGIDNEGKPIQPIKISTSLEITAVTRDENSENWGRLLEFYDRDNKHHSWAMPMDMLGKQNNEHVQILLNLGLELTSEKNVNGLLKLYINTANPSKRALCTNKIGWYDSVFVLPNQTVGANDNSETIVFQSPSVVHHHFAQNGTLEEWRDNIGKLCPKNSRLIFSVSAALAVPLAELLKVDLVGFHFVGASSTGKTTALKVSASIWGAPSYIQQWRTTSNALEGLALLRNNAPLILDEISQANPKDIGECIYMVANGQIKGRAHKDGSPKKITKFRTCILSSGEETPANLMSEVGKKPKAGQEIRLISIQADAGKGLGIFEDLHGLSNGSVLSQLLGENATKYYGTPAIVWLEVLVSIKADILKNEQGLTQLEIMQALFKKYESDLLEPHPDAEGQVRRAASAFALMMVAGEYATGVDITGWQKNDAYNCIKLIFSEWIQKRGSAINQEELDILRQVKGIIEKHGESSFTSINSEDGKFAPITRDRIGFKKKNTDDNVEYLILPEQYKECICKGRDYRTVTKILRKYEWLIPDGKYNQQTQRIPDCKNPVKLYVLSADKIFSTTIGGLNNKLNDDE